jgi:hypothetical protein
MREGVTLLAGLGLIPGAPFLATYFLPEDELKFFFPSVDISVLPRSHGVVPAFYVENPVLDERNRIVVVRVVVPVHIFQAGTTPMTCPGSGSIHPHLVPLTVKVLIIRHFPKFFKGRDVLDPDQVFKVRALHRSSTKR